MKKENFVITVNMEKELHLVKPVWVKDKDFYVPNLPGPRQYRFASGNLVVEDLKTEGTSCLYSYEYKGLVGVFAVNRYTGKAKVLTAQGNTMRGIGDIVAVRSLVFRVVQFWGSEYYKSYISSVETKGPKKPWIPETPAEGDPETIDYLPKPPKDKIIILKAAKGRNVNYTKESWWSRGYYRGEKRVPGREKHRKEELLKGGV